MAEEFKIVETNVLKVEVFYMPVIDTSIRFGYRFIEPVPMIWQLDGRTSHQLTLLRGSVEDVMKKFFLNKWYDVVLHSKSDPQWGPGCEFLDQVNQVEIIECDIIQRNTTETSQGNNSLAITTTR